jgi:2-polyprenyl-3-methyl-5-hydroxy-6-metoxy-1,4-benzoquinol methylase
VSADYRQRVYDSYASVSGLNTPLKSKRDSLRRNLGPWLRSARGPLLDVGSGQGELLEVCQELQIAAEGLDVSAELAASCTTRGLQVSTITDLPSSLADGGNRYGIVTMIDVLEHFTRPEALELAETIRTRTLSPQGRLIIQVPNMQSPFATLNLYHDITHQWAYTEASLRQLLRSAGFRKVQCCPQNYPMTGAYVPRQLLRLGFYAAVRLLLLVDQPSRGRILTPNLIAIADS